LFVSKHNGRTNEGHSLPFRVKSRKGRKMKSDPDKVDSFLERLRLKPATSAPAQPPPKAHQPVQRAKRAPSLVMRMDGWNISGNVVIMSDAGDRALERVLGAKSANGGA
jgi:hypothetical protein